MSAAILAFCSSESFSRSARDGWASIISPIGCPRRSTSLFRGCLGSAALAGCSGGFTAGFSEGFSAGLAAGFSAGLPSGSFAGGVSAGLAAGFASAGFASAGFASAGLGFRGLASEGFGSGAFAGAAGASDGAAAGLASAAADGAQPTIGRTNVAPSGCQSATEPASPQPHMRSSPPDSAGQPDEENDRWDRKGGSWHLLPRGRKFRSGRGG